MTSQNIFLLGLCGFVLSAIGYFAVVQKSPQAVIDQIKYSFLNSRPIAARADEDPETEKPKTAPPIRAVQKQAAPVATVEIATPIEAPKPTPKPTRPLPSTVDISAGMQRSELLARFPDPALLTRTIKDGDMIELFAYQRQDQPKATFAQLQNGVVTRVYSGLPTSSFPRQLNP